MGSEIQRQYGSTGKWEEQAAIAKAIREGDSDRAAALSEKHAELARETLMQHLRESEEEALDVVHA